VTVHLVGAGPGDPELITVRGAALLARADVILYDRLVARALLELAPAGAERIDVGKQPGRPSRQGDINALLIEHGGKGREVVRLKGGDPFLFGRGGEEAEALQAAGIPYDVVPGVTSAFAAPAAAGIPVTHRGLSTSVTVVTGHVGDPSAPGGVDWQALARAGGTLVVMMGMAHRDRARIAEALIAGGRPGDTPVTVVHWGTTDEQRTARTTLDGLADVELPAPCTIVIGPVAGLDLLSAVGMTGGSSPAGTTGGSSPTGGPCGDEPT
jgi:uroporphyrin-III C-methyltransferase